MPETFKLTEQKKFYRNSYLYFILAFLVTIIGFSHSYFSKLTTTDKSHHFHGITATLWFLLLIVQPLLYRFGKIKLHRIIGRFSFFLVPLIVAGGLNMVYLMLVNKANYPPNVPYQLAFIDFTTLPLFIVFYVLAIVYRRNIQLHARYMACTVLGPLLPALNRLVFLFPVVDSFNKSLNISYMIVELVLLLLIADDNRSGKIRTPYVLALALFALQHLLMSFAANWNWWHMLMDAYAK